MQIRVGYDLRYAFPQPTPMILTLNVHYSRASDLVRPDLMLTDPAVPIRSYRDGFGNWCARLVAPKGHLRIFSDAVVNDPGTPDPISRAAEQHPVEALPEETLVFLVGSRYCETDRLSETAWRLFAESPPAGRACKPYVTSSISTSSSATNSRARRRPRGRPSANAAASVRDFAHLAIALCRAMNIPARYCTGYLGDIGVPPPHGRWTSPAGSRLISAASGTRSIRATTSAHRARPDRARA
jgi:transglutaminase-like putative cysteine protease